MADLSLLLHDIPLQWSYFSRSILIYSRFLCIYTVISCMQRCGLSFRSTSSLLLTVFQDEGCHVISRFLPCFHFSGFSLLFIGVMLFASVIGIFWTFLYTHVHSVGFYRPRLFSWNLCSWSFVSINLDVIKTN